MIEAIALSLALLLHGPVGSLTAEPPPVAKIHVYPKTIDLHHASDTRRFIVVAEFVDGTTREITEEARVAFGDNPPITIDSRFTIHPLRDGSGELTVSYRKQRATVPITVQGAGTQRKTSFQNDVIPVLTRAGCNAGTCHGNSAGKNGFRLSLFGFDLASDHKALTRELRGRRTNPSEPDSSLMLTKPMRLVSHKGGKRIQAGTQSHRILRDWIASGAGNDSGKSPQLVEIRVLPDRAVLDVAGDAQRFMVEARYSDDTRRDVTDLALLTTNNEPVATVAGDGKATTATRGEAFLLARFGGFAEVAQILVVPKAEAFEFPSVPAINYIDEAMYDKQRRMKVAPVEVCDDATFLRRVYLDIINLLPSVDETRAFLASDDPDKRSRVVDRLLARPEFPDVQAMQWAEVLRVESRRLERKGMHVYTEYLRDAFRDNVPLDKLVFELLIAKGSNFRNAPANFYMTQRRPNLIAEDVAQNFLGIRVQCAQCHNHPFERWTMDDYYGFSAFFARVGRKRGEHPYESIIYPRTGGEIRNRRTNKNAAPKFLGGAAPEIDRNADRRVALAKWLTAADNPWFKTSVANRIWARFFGRGIVDPVDDVRVSNPPSHPDLYRKLGDKLVEYDFDVRRLIRDICASRTYQLATADGNSSAGTPTAGTYVEAPVRRLTAEQLLDAISQVTGVPERYRNLPKGARATQVEDGNPRNRFLDIFGRPQRTSACTCDRRSEPTLSQALHLINGRTIADRIRNAKGRLQSRLRAGVQPAALLEELFLAAYSRPPDAEEARQLLAELQQPPEKPDPKQTAAAWEDVFWAILNSKEFLFNH